MPDESSRTEQPTSKRLAEAHREGNFPQSQEIGTVFVLTAAFTVFAFFVKEKAVELAMVTRGLLGQLANPEITQERAVQGMGDVLQAILLVITPILIGTSFAAILAGGLQSGFRLTPKRLEPKLSKLNPINGAKRIFRPQSMVQLGFDLLKFTALAVILYGLIRELMKDDIFYTPVPPAYLGEFLYKSAMLMLVRLILALGVIAIISYAYQRYRVKRDLMMTRQEVKDERKSADVNPEVRSTQRQMARQILQKQMLDAVPLADVVVTNPTHYAVAMKYEQEADTAPMVLAKGKNLYARRIIDIASKFGVPRIENRPIAGLLFRIGRVGEAIPVELYEVVATILAHVYRTHRYYFHLLKSRRVQRHSPLR